MSTAPVLRSSSEPTKGFSDAVVLQRPGRLIHVSGHVGFAPDSTELVTGGLRAEAEATFDNIERTLAAVGAGLGDLVRLTAYLVDLDEYAEFSAVRLRRFRDNPPASAAVGVSGLLFGARIEIEGTAFLPDA